ncbi:TetR/AcrR family transcriptional regulator [Sphaerochaeta globosa]|uniref:Regulatory protein TetR n=1 Tax=Sphaerochaeta globosa (strain ATCC BAA-1886 / DSM 22777 / Buddy) TaxID=158189 RepID=F0RSY2_SPHGB|nr:TetR/AcrR family transcriptional regulator [Sphaerochaeta globosa]ADY13929.1 regulatory protein TetR [Sphaerochaeta globosa str. Buddy]
MNEIFTFSPKGQKRKQQLFETALSVFSEYGYRKTSMEDIALRMQVAVGTLYRYVKDKQDLYIQCVAYAFERWQSYALQQARAQQQPLERFKALCMSAFSYMQKETRLRRILASDPALFPVLDGTDPFAHINEKSVQLLASVIQEAVDAKEFFVEDVQLAAQILFSLYRFSIERAYVEESGSEERRFSQSLDLVLNGLLARETHKED